MTRPIIHELLEEIQRNLKILERLKSLTEDEFVADPEKYLLAERCFQLCIQCVLDISGYIASQKGWQRPANSSEALEVLARQGVLTKSFVDQISGMANFRNILVHAYLGINRSIVYSYLSKLEDFREFSRQILDFLDKD